MSAWDCDKVFDIVHLIVEAKPYEEQFWNCAFGLGAVREHWPAGSMETRANLAHPEFLCRPLRHTRVVIHDVHRHMGPSRSAR